MWQFVAIWPQKVDLRIRISGALPALLHYGNATGRPTNGIARVRSGEPVGNDPERHFDGMHRMTQLVRQNGAMAPWKDTALQYALGR